MTDRITDKQLAAVCNYLNRTMERPERYRTEDDKIAVGHFCIDHAYGGVALHEVSNEAGGVHDVFNAGHMPKRDLFNRIHALLDGIRYERGLR